MSKLVINSDFFETLEADVSLQPIDFDYKKQLDAFATSTETTKLTALQLSSTLIRLTDQRTEANGTVAKYEYQLSGSGLKPVSTLKGLIAAIEDGVASGTLNHLKILRNGVDFFDISAGSTGVTFSTGGQSLRFDGKLPYTFDQLYKFADLAGQIGSVDAMTKAERTAFFNDFTAFGVTGFSIKDGTDTALSFKLTTHDLTFKIGDFTLHATGTFPTNLGDALNLAWKFGTQMAAQSLTPVSSFGASSVTLTDSSGHVLFSGTGLDDGTAPKIVVDGHSFDNADMDLFGGGYLEDNIGTLSAALAGLGGDDEIHGLGGSDLLFGGSGDDFLAGGKGNDTFDGGAGFDTAALVDYYVASTGSTADLAIKVAQNTGLGFDLLKGIEGLWGGTGADTFYGNASGNLLAGDGGADVLTGRGGNDTLVGGDGSDMLLGGDGRDTFVFNAANFGVGIDTDTVKGFIVGTDILELDSIVGLTAKQVVNTYAAIEHGHVVLNLPSEEKIILFGVSSLTGLAGSIHLLDYDPYYFGPFM